MYDQLLREAIGPLVDTACPGRDGYRAALPSRASNTQVGGAERITYLFRTSVNFMSRLELVDKRAKPQSTDQTSRIRS